jgi:hypothetical protein
MITPLVAHLLADPKKKASTENSLLRRGYQPERRFRVSLIT